MVQREAIYPANRQPLHGTNRYAAAIRSEDLPFVWGQVGGREGGSPEPGFAAQRRLARRDLAAVLEARDAPSPTSWT